MDFISCLVGLSGFTSENNFCRHHLALAVLQSLASSNRLFIFFHRDAVFVLYSTVKRVAFV